MGAELTKCLGVDFGSSQAAVVYLRLVDGRPLLRRAVCLDLQSEGLLNGQELRQAVGEWLQHRRLHVLPASCGLSSSLASSAILTFPAEHSDEDVQKIIRFQTKQLCGLADEPFCNDSQFLVGRDEMAPRTVILSVCRQRPAEDLCRQFSLAGLEVRNLTDNAQAIANAFAFLYPEEAASSRRQLILDIGHQDTTVILWQDGQPRYTGTIPFGGLQFDRRLAAAWGCDEQTAARRKAEAQDDWLDPDSVLNQTIHAFAAELHAGFAQFPEQHLEPNGNVKAPCQFWLTGGGAIMAGLDRTLSRVFHCPVQVFGVPQAMLATSRDAIGCPEGLDCHPRLTTAFGLALQGLGLAPLRLSLLPERIRWQQHKRRELPFLMAAALLFIATLLLSLGAFVLNLRQKAQDALHQKERLETCLELIPKLTKAYEEIDYRQRQLLPIAEYGLRLARYVEALDSCREVFSPGALSQSAFCFYLADAFSFAEDFPSINKPKTEAAPQPKRMDPAPVGTSLFTPPAPPAAPVEKAAPTVEEMPLLRTMYLGGLAGADDEHFLAVKEIQTRFHGRPAFANVDDCIDSVRVDEDNRIFPSWKEFCQEQSEKLEEKHAVFLLRLPFSTTLASPASPTVPPAIDDVHP